MMEGYTFDDLDIDLIDLRGLIGEVHEILSNMTYERDGKRDTDLDRVASLVRVAQTFSGLMEANVQNLRLRQATTTGGAHV